MENLVFPKASEDENDPMTDDENNLTNYENKQCEEAIPPS